MPELDSLTIPPSGVESVPIVTTPDLLTAITVGNRTRSNYPLLLLFFFFFLNEMKESGSKAKHEESNEMRLIHLG